MGKDNVKNNFSDMTDAELFDAAKIIHNDYYHDAQEIISSEYKKQNLLKKTFIKILKRLQIRMKL